MMKGRINMGIRGFLRAAGDVVLPRDCVVCGCRLNTWEEYICLGCMADMPLTRFWERRSNPMADRLNERIQKIVENTGRRKRNTETKDYIENESHIELEQEGQTRKEDKTETENHIEKVGQTRKVDNESYIEKDEHTGEKCHIGKESHTGEKDSTGKKDCIENDKGTEDDRDDVAGGGIGYERYAYAAALFFYHSEAGYRQIPYHIKYQGNIAAGKYFGRMLGRKLAEAAMGTKGTESETDGWGGNMNGSIWADVDIVIPVPLHWTRKWKRGYNQAEVIAGAVAAEMGAVMRTDILVRQRRTKTQVKLNIEEKMKNVSGAFTVSDKSRKEFMHESGNGNNDSKGGRRSTGLKGIKHILLVDDVFTTGSTLVSCFNALREVFPKSVRISAVTLGYLER